MKMKQTYRIRVAWFVPILILLFGPGTALYADYGQNHYDQLVVIREDIRAVVASGTIVFEDDSIGNWHTQAIYIADCNSIYDGIVTAWTNNESGDDVNLLVEYSFDRSTWKAATVGSGKILDDLNGGTLQSDTVNVVVGVPDPLYNAAVWIRLKFTGETGNPVATIVTWALRLTKTDPATPLRRGSRVQNKL